MSKSKKFDKFDDVEYEDDIRARKRDERRERREQVKQKYERQNQFFAEYSKGE